MTEQDLVQHAKRINSTLSGVPNYDRIRVLAVMLGSLLGACDECALGAELTALHGLIEDTATRTAGLRHEAA